MEPTPRQLLDALPPYRDEWVLVKENQNVYDIIRDVLTRHKDFAPYYDDIALFFDGGELPEICNRLYKFCKRYLRYYEEPEDAQTTAIPTGLLTRGHCDCKGYAGFIAGCLDGIKRLTGRPIDWAYRFASYKFLDSSPHHVFVIVNDPAEGEIWVDPTPGSRDKVPVWQLDKTVKTMPLLSNIGGISGRSLGITSITVRPVTSFAGNMGFQYAPWPYSVEPFRYFLGLDQYRDYSGDRDISEASVAQALNAMIAKGPAPGHTVDPTFVKWVYDNSIRSWNFYYPGGVDPNFDETPFIPSTFSWTDSAGHRQTIAPPHWVITPDHRVTFDHDVELDDYRNWLIHILTAAAQKYINAHDASGGGTAYPLKPRDLKLFSQAYTGNPGNPNASILKEWRAESDVSKALEAASSAIVSAFKLVVGAIPRNAFFALVGINVFRMATDLQNSINAGKWDDISKKWKNLGGDPDKLRNTIEHGAGQPSEEDPTKTISSADQISGTSIGNPAVIAAVLTAAAPIIAILANYFTHSHLQATAGSYVDALNAQNPAGNYSLVNGQLYSNGVPVQGVGADVGADKNIIMVAVIVAGATYWIANRKRGGRRKRILLPIAAGVGTWLLLRARAHSTAAATMSPQVYQGGATSPQTSPITQILTQIPNLITQISTAGSNPTATENTPSGTYSAGDAQVLNPDLADAALAGWVEGAEPFFDD